MNLSVVMAGRNDDYGGGDYLRRMNQCLRSVAPLGCEIIMVEWNPPPDRTSLVHVIEVKGVRVITVDPELCSQMHGADLMPMFEYRAKNVGIRRAKGDWILVMNSDIQLTPEMRERLDKGIFDRYAIYRCLRQDMHNGEIVQTTDGPGDFVLMHKHRWHELRGYLDLVSYTHIDSLLYLTAQDLKIPIETLKEFVIHEEHDRSDHKSRWGIHSSDIHRFIGQRNEEDWGLRDIRLTERMT